jgi:FemAB-related protein (PEP-CTERM system-associated)
MNSSLKVDKYLDGDDGSAWERFLEKSPSSTLSHRFCWNGIITRTYRHPTFYLAAREGEEIVGVLPLVWVKSAMFGNSLVSMPFMDRGGICTTDPEVVRAILDHAVILRDQMGADLLELRHQSPLSNRGIVSSEKASLVLDLSEGPEAIWKKLPAKVRNQVRKASKSGLSAVVGGIELLDEFYPVLARNMRDLGSPVHHRTFFSTICVEFGEDARLVLVRDGRRAVGGLVSLCFKDTMVVPWASSLREYFWKCPNNILYWEAIVHGCNRGVRLFDFGRSTIGSGTYHFKRQWGAVPVQLHWERFFREGSKSRTSDSPGLRLAATLWKRLPVSWTVLVGPHIRKYIAS